MESKVSICKVYDVDKLRELLEGIQAAACMISDVPPIVDEASVVRRIDELTVVGSHGSVCGCCGAGPFKSRQLQTQHYRCPWHTYNVRRRIFGKRSITEEEFKERDNGGSSTSSESDSDSEETLKKGGGDMSELFLAATRHCRAYFNNKSGQVLSVYRCLLHHKKEVIGTDGMGQGWVKACQGLLDSGGWAVLMCSGGHFAGAIFRGPSGIPIKHKTFHAYVTRRGQGKAQLSKDAQGNAPRSAGASLRRYNQEKYMEHVQEVLMQWKDDLQACSLILYRAVGPLNQRTLFGPDSPLKKEDKRLRTLPFPTRRPSHKEVLRSHSILSSVEVYESSEAFQKALSSTVINESYEKTSSKNNSRSPRSKKAGLSKLDRAKSREITVRPLPQTTPMSSEDETPSYQQGLVPIGWTKTLALRKKLPEASKDFLKSSDDDSQSVDKASDELRKLEINSTLDGLDDSVKKKTKPKKKNQETTDKNNSNAIGNKQDQNNKSNNKDKQTNEAKTMEDADRKSKTGKNKAGVTKVTEKIKELWESLLDDTEILKNKIMGCGETSNIKDSLNTPDPADGNTSLHKAAVAQRPDTVSLLLELGADPCAKNQQLQTPYTATSHAETRIAFRLFQGANPDMYNYAKANIPGGLTPEMLEQEKEKKAAQKKAKRLKEKEKEKEKSRVTKFLEKNDKEKIASSSDTRCFICGSIYAVPFNYEEYKFCSVKCLQNHRNTRPLKLSAQ